MLIRISHQKCKHVLIQHQISSPNCISHQNGCWRWGGAFVPDVGRDKGGVALVEGGQGAGLMVDRGTQHHHIALQVGHSGEHVLRALH